MAKKFNELYKEQENRKPKTDGIETAKARLSPQTKGEKRKYTKLQNKENKTKIVTVLLTETEYNDLIEMCEKLNKKSISECIRGMIHDSLNTFQSKLIK